jgi:cobalt-zinc-cadmium resistance protein CzcA
MLSQLIQACVHRRVAAVFVTLVVAAFGLRAYVNTPIEAFPDVTNAQVTVISQMPGYASQEIERLVTVPLERVLNGTPGMTLMRSQSLFGLSLITLTFRDGADPFSSRLLVAQRLTQVELPDRVQPKLAAEATPLGEVYQFRLVSDRHDLYQLRSELEWTVSRTLRQVQGVADMVAFGGFLKEVHVVPDPARLHAVGVSLAQLDQAIAGASVNVGGGFLRRGEQELTIRSLGFIESAEDIRAIVLKSRGGSPVTVGDVAEVRQSYTPRRGSVGWNEQPEVVEGFVLMRRGENPSRVLSGIHERVRELNEEILPSGMRIEPFYDRSTLIERTLHTVHENLLHGFVLVVAVVWLFLRSLYGSAIVAVVIPLSLLAAFLGLHALGLPANLISMGAIDFGILVDGAVVLVENVQHALRHQRPRDRAGVIRVVIQSAVDIGKPTFYAMLIIIVALLPVFTLESVEGRIFRPLALTYAFALLGALVFALTIVPALCAFAFRPADGDTREPAWQAHLADGYRRTLARLLRARAKVIAAALLLLVVAALAGKSVGTEFLPELDEGDFLVFVEMPASVSLERGQEILREVRRRILAFPEVKETLSEHGRPEDGTDNEGVNTSETFVRLKPREEWRGGVDKSALMREMRASLNGIPGVRFNFSQPIKDNVEEAVSGVRGKVVLKIFGDDLAAMRASLVEAIQVLGRIEGVVELDLFRDSATPQLQIILDRAALARAGIAMAEAQTTIETALAGRVVTQYFEGERVVPIRVILPLEARDDAERIAALTLTGADGARIPLAQLARIESTTGLAKINREGNTRFLALKFNVEDRDLGSTVREAVREVREKVRPPDGHRFVWGGEFENQQRAVARLQLIVPVAVLLVLALLYMAMRSGRTVIAILLTVPFAQSGGAFALFLADVPLSVSAAIGFITLLGQVSLMGLLLLGATEERRRAGQSLEKALVGGCADRLRPVLMASMLAMFGLLPMALATGVGSETQRPFALVVVGGMATTLVISLFVLPVLYSLLTPRRLVSPEEEDGWDRSSH